MSAKVPVVSAVKVMGVLGSKTLIVPSSKVDSVLPSKANLVPLSKVIPPSKGTTVSPLRVDVPPLARVTAVPSVRVAVVPSARVTAVPSGNVTDSSVNVISGLGVSASKTDLSKSSTNACGWMAVSDMGLATGATVVAALGSMDMDALVVV